jgi:hypothetical protein
LRQWPSGNLQASDLILLVRPRCRLAAECQCKAEMTLAAQS